MARRVTTTEINLHDIRAVEISQAKGDFGDDWLTIITTDVRGRKTELTVWGVDRNVPEVIVEDDVSVRRVQTIGEGE